MMTIPEYRKAAQQFESDYSKVQITASGLTPYNAARLIHCALGLATEALELREAIKNNDHTQQIAELGDIAWYAAIAMFDDVEPSALRHDTVEQLYTLCETFASRVKAGAFYGNPVHKSDPQPYSWRQLPESILYCTAAIARRHGVHQYLEANIQKLTIRNRGKVHDAVATVDRDTKVEDAAITKTLAGGSGPVRLASGNELSEFLAQKRGQPTTK